jgi:hypothetical protein
MIGLAPQTEPAVDDPRRRFIDTQVLAMVLQATIQRAAIYSASATEPERLAFRGGVRRMLGSVHGRYLGPVSGEEHIAQIADIADTISREHGGALRGGRFRFGPAQKALNLYLKYHWCLCRLPAPPHCPFDALVINTLPVAVRLNWTQLDDAELYRRLVTAAQTQARGQSLAEWELDLYDRLLSPTSNGAAVSPFTRATI